MKFFITGGAGFVGSSLVRFLINETDHEVINFDKLTYAGNLDKVKEISDNPRYQFIKGDISDRELISKIFAELRPDKIIHMAAESHVDRSITGPAEFIKTNIIGTYILLEESLKYFQGLNIDEKNKFIFHHVSTDEVYGDLDEFGKFSENSSYNPSSPYSASKASADHLVRAWGRTYNLPFIITNSSNNYGPFQHLEKLIPLVISKAIKGEKIPVFGTGENVRDWLYVKDHAKAIDKVAMSGKKFETYNIGGNCEQKNIDVIRKICRALDSLLPLSSNIPRENLITFGTDRPGHDFRYALDIQKIQRDIGWSPETEFDKGLFETIKWYIEYLK
jgi:dTDP-glucose 4,6-dehydratase